MADDIFDSEIYTLTDEEGNENQFELLGTIEVDGKSYVGLVPAGEEDADDGEYILLKVVVEDGEEMLVTIDDDDEFDKVADAFEDEYMAEIDYDGLDEDEEEDEDSDDEDEDDE